jgi:hypothetical protein
VHTADSFAVPSGVGLAACGFGLRTDLLTIKPCIRLSNVKKGLQGYLFDERPPVPGPTDSFGGRTWSLRRNAERNQARWLQRSPE